MVVAILHLPFCCGLLFVFSEGKNDPRPFNCIELLISSVTAYRPCTRQLTRVLCVNECQIILYLTSLWVRDSLVVSTLNCHQAVGVQI